MNDFFGSKLNSILLLVLIILMVIAIKVMLKTPDTYLSFMEEDTTKAENVEVLGNKNDLVSFSINPGAKVGGLVAYQGVIKGAYFFEANILVNVLDASKKILKMGNAMATTDWMTVEPVSFEGKLDFTGLPKGPAYIEIHNDNASGLPENDKSILIPIVIE